ncbi:Uncharacterized protein TCAP_04715 [Tolypocladium capitatum]|uniref:Secreted protein n=1 Tax=Tolypocladium capitatum TaxID=45235 RepID=A0A2K3QCT3_9HYPO|nr:Uncharacterized protein TCAP_04715 [Tolypocladium capitatum]
MQTFATFAALAVVGYVYGNPTATTTTTRTSTKSKCQAESCVPTVTVMDHLRPKDGCNVQCSTDWAGHIAVWMHDGGPSRDQDQDDLPNVAVLVLHHRVPVHDYRGVSDDDIQARSAKFRVMMLLKSMGP